MNRLREIIYNAEAALAAERSFMEQYATRVRNWIKHIAAFRSAIECPAVMSIEDRARFSATFIPPTLDARCED